MLPGVAGLGAQSAQPDPHPDSTISALAELSRKVFGTNVLFWIPAASRFFALRGSNRHTLNAAARATIT